MKYLATLTASAGHRLAIFYSLLVANFLLLIEPVRREREREGKLALSSWGRLCLPPALSTVQLGLAAPATALVLCLSPPVVWIGICYPTANSDQSDSIGAMEIDEDPSEAAVKGPTSFVDWR